MKDHHEVGCVFLRRGRTVACLNVSGKIPSDNDMLIIVVIGWIKTSRQDFSRNVGMVSREHVAFDDIRIAFLTSS